MSDSKLVELEISDAGVALVRLNRPLHGNALSLSLVRELAEAIDNIDADSAVRCILVTGSGRFFCVGGDIGDFSRAGPATPALLKQITTYLNAVISRLARADKPVIVAVNGPAAGAGFGLAAMGDIVLAAESAHFTMAYTAIGLTPDGATSWLLPRLVGLRRAQEMALTNRRVGSQEAVDIGLVSRVVADVDLFAEAQALAATMAAGPTHAYGAVRRLFASGHDTGLETQMELEARSIALAAAHPEGLEGVAAFLEKRKPNFRSPDLAALGTKQCAAH